jgi:hypothetical protein
MVSVNLHNGFFGSFSGGGTWPSGQRSALASQRSRTGSKFSGGSEITFRSDLPLTAGGGSM